MKSKINSYFYFVLLTAVIFSNCTNSHNQNISIKNSLSIFMLNNGKNYFFCIPVQYIGDYHIGNFQFDNGSVIIGDFEIPLKSEELNISVYLNETSDESGKTIGEYELIYKKENDNVLISKMKEPIAAKIESDYMMNQYNIFIEKYLSDNEMKKIIREYKKGNVDSKMSVWYNITIDNEEQAGCGMLDDFELHNEFAQQAVWALPHFKFFITKYLQK